MEWKGKNPITKIYISFLHITFSFVSTIFNEIQKKPRKYCFKELNSPL